MDQEKKGTRLDWQIVGINLLILIIYNLICKIADSRDGWGILMLLIAFQVFTCVVIAISCFFIPKFKQVALKWFLSGLMILVIGFSTCVTLYKIEIP